MAGIIEDEVKAGAGAESQEPPAEERNQAPVATAAEDAPQAGGSTLTITPQSLVAKFQLKGNQAQQLQRIVLAGKKVMFDEKTSGLISDALNNGEGDLVQKLGTGITGLMALLIEESRKSIPGELVIPAGLVLTAEAAQFLAEAGVQITDKDVADAMEIFVHVVLHQSGLDPEKMKAAGAAGAAGAAEEANQAAQQGAPAQEPGLINQELPQ